MLVPERGNYPFMNGPAPYMNGYLNMNGAGPIHVLAHPFLFACFFEFGRTLSPLLRPMYLLSFSPPAKKIVYQYSCRKAGTRICSSACHRNNCNCVNHDRGDK